MFCEYCHEPLRSKAVVVSDTALVHEGCERPYRLAQLGLTHPCPKCNCTGEVPDPKKTRTHEVKLADGETPDCAYDGCMGCRFCMMRTKLVVLPEMQPCPLCEGHGRLKHAAKPVMGVIGWETSSAGSASGGGR
jgi:hypothetical protein